MRTQPAGDILTSSGDEPSVPVEMISPGLPAASDPMRLPSIYLACVFSVLAIAAAD